MFRIYIILKCLIVTKRDDENWMKYVCRINSDFEKSGFNSFANDHFKCFFVSDLIEEKYEISLQDLGDYYVWTE